MSRDGVNWGLFQFCWGYGLCEFCRLFSFLLVLELFLYVVYIDPNVDST